MLFWKRNIIDKWHMQCGIPIRNPVFILNYSSYCENLDNNSGFGN